MKDLPHIEWTNPPTTWLERTGGYAKSMDLRDYFAAKAMQMIGAPNPVTGQYPTLQDFGELARGSYLMADAMLKARGA